MYCINCGKELPDDANFCSNCGAKVALSGDNVPSAANVIAGVDPNSERIASELAVTRLKSEIDDLFGELSRIHLEILSLFKDTTLHNILYYPLTYRNPAKQERWWSFENRHHTTEEKIVTYGEILEVLLSLIPKVEQSVTRYKPGLKVFGSPTKAKVEKDSQTFQAKIDEFKTLLTTVTSKSEELKSHQRKVGSL